MVPARVFLVGPMGAGKSSIGRHLARQLGFVFLDSDAEIEARTGADIPWIFDVEGEAGFRDREERVIVELSTRDKVVLATGGGAVLRPENRRVLSSRGHVVYLAASVEELARRTGGDRRRPLLQDGEPAQVLARLLRERDALYREIADTVFETDRVAPQVVARQLAGQLREATV